MYMVQVSFDIKSFSLWLNAKNISSVFKNCFTCLSD